MQDLASPLTTELEPEGPSYAARRAEAREALERLSQLIAAATPATAVAVVLLDGEVERAIATSGLAPYTVSQRTGLSAHVLTSALARTLNGAELLAYGVVLPINEAWHSWSFCLRRLQSRWGNSVGLLWMARDKDRPFLPPDITLFDQSALLVERELGFLARHEDIINQRERATVEVAQFHEDLLQQHNLYRELVKHLPNTGVLIFDSDLRIQLNEGWQSFSSLPTGLTERLGRHVIDCFSPTESVRIDAVCRHALQGSHESLELQWNERTFDLSVGPLRSATGAITLGMIVTRDISEERRKHERSTATNTRLEALVHSLEAGILVEDENRLVQVCSNRLCELMQLDVPSEQYVGSESCELTSKMASICFIPEAFEESTLNLIDSKKSHRQEVIYLADMRIIERDYSPLSMSDRPMGHLWVYRDVTQREQSKDLLQRQADELRALSLVDELTGLYNRRGFLTLATQQLKLCDRTMRPAVVVFVDLDGMKRINDDFGHDVGDQALIETANILRQCFRYSDVVARLGGDEFVTLAIDADFELSGSIQQRLYDKLAELNARVGRTFELQFSIGMAPYDPASAEMIEEVLARADSLMYEQKRARKAIRKS